MGGPVAKNATKAGARVLSGIKNRFCILPANWVAKTANQGIVNAKFSYE
jgi:hypothetical protein